MPTVFFINGFRFAFFSFDCREPMHIHVFKNDSECKFWLSGRIYVKLSYNYGFTRKQLNFIKKQIEANFATIKAAWDEHCKGQKQSGKNN